MNRVVIAALMTVLATSLAQARQDVQVETLIDGLEYPWSLAELPDGRLLVTEQSGRLRLVVNGVLQIEPVGGAPDVLYSGQGGLMDIALHPDFEQTGLVYLTWSVGERRDNQLVLGRGVFDGANLIGLQEIFRSDARVTDSHYGARLAFLPDGTLLLGVGDAFDMREQAQRPENYHGSYVHLRADGSPVAGGVEGAAPGVYSVGHRNPQAIAVDPATGLVYSHEHGPRGGDEINILEEGGNYGWPITSYGIDYSGALVTPFESYDGMVEPLLHWTPSIAPAGMSVYRGEMFPDWQGDLLVAALIPGDAGTVSGHVRRVNLEAGTVVGQDILLGDINARIRDVRVASDGSILVLTDEADGQIIRLSR